MRSLRPLDAEVGGRYAEVGAGVLLMSLLLVYLGGEKSLYVRRTCGQEGEIRQEGTKKCTSVRFIAGCTMSEVTWVILE